MEIVYHKIKDLFLFLKKSKIKAGAGLEEGLYPFYTSSQDLKKYYNEYTYQGESLIFGTGGKPSIHFAKLKFSTSTDCFVIQKIDYFIIDVKYCYYFLSSNISILEKGFHGAGLKHISKEYLKKIKIPIPYKNAKPDLLTQKRIAKILSHTESLIAKRKKSIQMLDEFVKATFLEMFGDPVRNEKGWEKKLVSDVSTSRLGKMLDSSKFTGKNLRPYLRNSNVLWFHFNLKELSEMDFKPDEQKEFELKFGDVLMCEGGEIGRCAIWKEEIKECYFQKAIHRIRLNKEIISPEYFVFMFWFLTKNGGLNKFIGTATISHLTGEKLKKIKIPIPPLPLQNQFAEIVKKTETLKKQFEQSLQELQNLYGSLSQRAFKGELDLSKVKILEEIEKKLINPHS